jgi:hypothetical protein
MSNLAPLVGVLQPGEEALRRYPAKLPTDTVAVLQKGLGTGGADLHIVAQTDASMHVANRGKGFAYYMILFVTGKQLRALLATKELASQIIGAGRDLASRKKKK